MSSAVPQPALARDRRSIRLEAHQHVWGDYPAAVVANGPVFTSGARAQSAGLAAAAARAQGAGLRPIGSGKPIVGAPGRRILFLDPAGADGVLIELKGPVIASGV